MLTRFWLVGLLASPASAFIVGVPPSSSRKLGRSRAVSDSVEKLFDPNLFSPVCTASDSLYRGAQQTVLLVVGSQTYQDYAPLIAGALLRVRLELCVVESFVTEAIVPFVREKGVSWVLPQTETIETFLAGSIFAVAINVIFIGSSKIISVLAGLLDLVLGLPARLLGKIPTPEGTNQVFVTTLAAVAILGSSVEVVRKVAEFADIFVARYLSLLTVAYLVIKFLHFRVFV